MKTCLRFFVSWFLIFAFFINALPCGPAFVTPVFEYKFAPENPFENFAAGKIGIVKPTLHRSVLIAAFRYVNGGGFSFDEQKALVEVWKAEFSNEAYQSEDVGEAVKKWIEKRKEVIESEEKTPEIYVEREYGGYDFFPNCTKSAFETATETLGARISSHGSSSKDVLNWVKAQDQVFTNCASGRQIPDPADETLPEWLRKDRAYQIAAAEFYSLNYDEARRRFEEIAEDSDSVWQETADYLVARTLIRQASLSKSAKSANEFYAKAEERLSSVISKGNKYGDSAEKLLGLIKYRLHPEERVGELAQKISYFSGNQNFRQDLIDYTWLLDKFEKEALETEEKRKEKEKAAENQNNSNSIITSNTNLAWENSNAAAISEKKNESDLKIYLYSDDYSQSWTFYVRAEAMDEEAITEAEKAVGRPLSEEMKARVRQARQTAYAGQFSEGKQSEYQGGYYGSEERSLSILPDFLRREEVTDWLFTYQIQGAESYLYALSKYRQTDSDLWLMTALSKADKNSSELKRLLEAAEKMSSSSPAYPTVAYHAARIYLEQNKTSEVKKLLDEILNSSLDLPVSSCSQFLDLRLKLAESLDDFLRLALRKPFTFDFGGQSGTIDEFIAQQKSWYDPKYSQQTREEYDREIEESFKNEKLWQDRLMFDYPTINVLNQHFPLSVLIEAEKSPALPDYMRESFAVAVWTKAVLLQDYAAAAKIEPELFRIKPELQKQLEQIKNSKTETEKENARLYLILKNPVLSPFIENPLEKSDNEANSYDTNDWWCAPFDSEYDDQTGGEMPAYVPEKPRFLTAEQSLAAQNERKKIKELGDAPKFLGEKVLEWAKRSPADKRVPESLFIIYEANGWKKYSCGNNEDLREKAAALLRKRYPQSEWTQKFNIEN
jgi:hypothetical protein